MSPPLTKEDLDAIGRLVDTRISAAKTATVPASRRAIDVQEVIPPAVARKISESQHNLEDRNKGFERLVLDSLTAMREETTASLAASNQAREIALRIEKQVKPRAVIELPDGKGGTSERPASLVAAESSVRTEVKQDGIAKVVVDAAIDTTKAKDNAAATKTISIISLIVQGLIIGVWTAWQLIASSGAPH